jgi:hypothetical protein
MFSVTTTFMDHMALVGVQDIQHHTTPSQKTATLTVMALSITQRNATFISALCSCSVANKQIMLSVVMMGIVMLSNAAPITHKNTSFKNILS